MRIALAEIAFDRFFQIRIHSGHLYGTIAMAQSAGHAFVMIHHHGAGRRISLDGIHRADRGAVRISTLVANRREVIEVLARMRDAEKCPMRIVSPQQALAAGQLTEFAARAQIKIGFDKSSSGHEFDF